MLQPRSLIVFCKEAYEDCLHSIRPVDEEVVGQDAPVINLEVRQRLYSNHALSSGGWALTGFSCSQEAGVEKGQVLHRGLRVSLTMRRVRRRAKQHSVPSKE